MARFGKYEFDRQHSTEDASWIYQSIIAPLYPLASSNPGALLDLLARNASSTGGWAAYGAGHAVWELLTSDQRRSMSDNDTYNAVMDASLEFLRQNGVPPKQLTGYEWDHWISRGGTIGTWIPPLVPPPRDAAHITPLGQDEIRPVARLWDAPDANMIFVQRSADGRHVAVVDARFSDDDPRRSRSDWKSAENLYDLYIDVASAIQTPPAWYDPELEPFFPLPRPSI
jgi:hypothetical protein